MVKELVEEVERWDMGPEPASLWRKSTYAKEEKQDMVIEPAGGKHILPVADAFRILAHLNSRDGRKQISLEQRMWSAVKSVLRLCFGCEMLRVWEMELEHGNDGQDLRKGNEDFTKSLQDW